jgi:hypothetical protein
VLKEEHRFGIYEVADKEAFIDDWPVDYGSFGRRYGESLSQGKDKQIFEKIRENAVRLEGNRIDDLILKVKNKKNLILLASRMAMINFWRSGSFKKADNSNPKYPYVNENGFEGFFIHEGYEIPVYSRTLGVEKIIASIHSDKLPNLIQYSPKNENEEDTLQRNGFHFNVVSFSENPVETEKLLNQQPEWLISYGAREEQKKLLEQKVLIDIYEKFIVEPVAGYRARYILV